jgi:hypothetical protein
LPRPARVRQRQHPSRPSWRRMVGKYGSHCRGGLRLVACIPGGHWREQRKR